MIRVVQPGTTILGIAFRVRLGRYHMAGGCLPTPSPGRTEPQGLFKAAKPAQCFQDQIFGALRTHATERERQGTGTGDGDRAY